MARPGFHHGIRVATVLIRWPFDRHLTPPARPQTYLHRVQRKGHHSKTCIFFTVHVFSLLMYFQVLFHVFFSCIFPSLFMYNARMYFEKGVSCIFFRTNSCIIFTVCIFFRDVFEWCRFCDQRGIRSACVPGVLVSSIKTGSVRKRDIHSFRTKELSKQRSSPDVLLKRSSGC